MFLFYSMVYNLLFSFILFSCFSFDQKRLLCPSDMLLSFFEHYQPFWHHKSISWAHIVLFLALAWESAISLRKLFRFIGALTVLVGCWSVIASRPPQQTELRNIYMCVCIFTHTFISISASLY